MTAFRSQKIFSPGHPNLIRNPTIFKVVNEVTSIEWPPNCYDEAPDIDLLQRFNVMPKDLEINFQKMTYKPFMEMLADDEQQDFQHTSTVNANTSSIRSKLIRSAMRPKCSEKDDDQSEFMSATDWLLGRKTASGGTKRSCETSLEDTTDDDKTESDSSSSLDSEEEEEFLEPYTRELKDLKDTYKTNKDFPQEWLLPDVTDKTDDQLNAEDVFALKALEDLEHSNKPGMFDKNRLEGWFNPKWYKPTRKGSAKIRFLEDVKKDYLDHLRTLFHPKQIAKPFGDINMNLGYLGYYVCLYVFEMLPPYITNYMTLEQMSEFVDRMLSRLMIKYNLKKLFQFQYEKQMIIDSQDKLTPTPKRAKTNINFDIGKKKVTNGTPLNKPPLISKPKSILKSKKRRTSKPGSKKSSTNSSTPPSNSWASKSWGSKHNGSLENSDDEMTDVSSTANEIPENVKPPSFPGFVFNENKSDMENKYNMLIANPHVTLEELIPFYNKFINDYLLSVKDRAHNFIEDNKSLEDQESEARAREKFIVDHPLLDISDMDVPQDEPEPTSEDYQTTSEGEEADSSHPKTGSGQPIGDKLTKAESTQYFQLLKSPLVKSLTTKFLGRHPQILRYFSQYHYYRLKTNQAEAFASLKILNHKEHDAADYDSIFYQTKLDIAREDLACVILEETSPQYLVDFEEFKRFFLKPKFQDLATLDKNFDFEEFDPIYEKLLEKLTIPFDEVIEDLQRSEDFLRTKYKVVEDDQGFASSVPQSLDFNEMLLRKEFTPRNYKPVVKKNLLEQKDEEDRKKKALENEEKPPLQKPLLERDHLNFDNDNPFRHLTESDELMELDEIEIEDIQAAQMLSFEIHTEFESPPELQTAEIVNFELTKGAENPTTDQPVPNENPFYYEPSENSDAELSFSDDDDVVLSSEDENETEEQKAKKWRKKLENQAQRFEEARLLHTKNAQKWIDEQSQLELQEQQLQIQAKTILDDHARAIEETIAGNKAALKKLEELLQRGHTTEETIQNATRSTQLEAETILEIGNSLREQAEIRRAKIQDRESNRRDSLLEQAQIRRAKIRDRESNRRDLTATLYPNLLEDEEEGVDSFV